MEKVLELLKAASKLANAAINASVHGVSTMHANRTNGYLVAEAQIRFTMVAASLGKCCDRPQAADVVKVCDSKLQMLTRIKASAKKRDIVTQELILLGQLASQVVQRCCKVLRFTPEHRFSAYANSNLVRLLLEIEGLQTVASELSLPIPLDIDTVQVGFGRRILPESPLTTRAWNWREYVLVNLVEESSEVASTACAANLFGISGLAKSGLTLSDEFATELVQMAAVRSLLTDNLSAPLTKSTRRAIKDNAVRLLSSATPERQGRRALMLCGSASLQVAKVCIKLLEGGAETKSSSVDATMDRMSVFTEVAQDVVKLTIPPKAFEEKVAKLHELAKVSVDLGVLCL